MKGDCKMKRTYDVPAACLLICEEDVICTSGLKYLPGGTGDLLQWEEL